MHIRFVREIAAAVLACCFATSSLADPTADHFPGASWDYVDPAKAGWSTDLLAQAQAWSRTIQSSAVMVIQHGRVVAEWGDTAQRIDLASVRKSFLSALIGNAVRRRQINLSAQIGKLGIDDNEPSLTPVEKTATVRDLLEARSGVYHVALYETSEMETDRPSRGSHLPGTFWFYNNWDFNALGAIYLQTTGTSIFDALEREIAVPLQMQDYRPSDGMYFTGLRSVYPAYPIRMSTRDLARFALLYLHKGRWGDKQVVPEDWVRESIQSYSRTDYGPGYGYLWWTDYLDPNNPLTPVHLPPGTFFASGSGGQYAIVIPGADMVVVNRVDRDVPNYHEVTLNEFGRLLWLILAAAHQPNIGPDVSMSSAKGTRMDDAALNAALNGQDFPNAQGRGGTFHFHVEADGHYEMFSGAPERNISRGPWTIQNDKFCIQASTKRPPRCSIGTINGNTLQFFDLNGLVLYQLSKSVLR